MKVVNFNQAQLLSFPTARFSILMITFHYTTLVCQLYSLGWFRGALVAQLVERLWPITACNSYSLSPSFLSLLSCPIQLLKGEQNKIKFKNGGLNLCQQFHKRAIASLSFSEGFIKLKCKHLRCK